MRDAFAAADIQLDCMATPFAISTYNLLLEEKRNVAAGLLAIPA
ncbi:MAG: Mth938-like domain-containing protein [Aestuariivirga sp.]